MLEKLKFNYNESYNQCNTFTPSHTRFEVEIERKETHQKIAFDYQCNTKYEEPCLESCLYAYISDAYAYIDAGKEKAYQDVKEFFTPREISYLRRKMEREGC